MAAAMWRATQAGWAGAVCAAAILAAPAPAPAAPVWIEVTHVTKARGRAYPEVVETRAEQAAAPAEKPEAGHTVFGGGNGPTTLRTRRLRFDCRGVTYAVPDAFVDDLLWLGADSSVRASLSVRDVVFTMIGSSGERQYTVYFDFRAGRFFQRILDYSDARTILVRTASDASTAQ